jgi:cellulose synthase operon protein C
VIEMRPEVSPRQVATAHMARALLISRAFRDAPNFIDRHLTDQVRSAVGITDDPAATRAEILKEDRLAMDHGDNPELLLIRATRFFHEEKYAAAATEIDTASSMSPDKAHCRASLARVLRARASQKSDQAAP